MKTTKTEEINTMDALAYAGNDIKELAAEFASFPTPDKWTDTQKSQAIRLAVLLHTAQKVIKAADFIGIDYYMEKQIYLDTAGRERSRHTRRVYANALKKLEVWTTLQHIDLLTLTPAQADDFINTLRAGLITDPDTHKAYGKSAATIRVTVAAVSGFYTFLHRRHINIENPFRGTKARPRETPSRTLVIPDAKELKTILKKLPPAWAAAVSIMATIGIRCGALPTLNKQGKRYKIYSKGKEYFIDLPSSCLKAIKAAGLDPKAPFAGRTANSIGIMVAYYIKKLWKNGEIKSPYSCHDFRHYAACREYDKTRDPIKVRDFLYHSSLSITERYLAALGRRN